MRHNESFGPLSSQRKIKESYVGVFCFSGYGLQIRTSAGVKTHKYTTVPAVIFIHYCRLAFLLISPGECSAVHNLCFVRRLLLFVRCPSLSNLEYL